MYFVLGDREKQPSRADGLARFLRPLRAAEIVFAHFILKAA